MWPLARQRQTWHVMLLSCVQGILFPLRKNSRLVRTIPSHTAGALLQASGAGLAKARAAVVQQLWSRMPSDVHIHMHVSSELRKGLCRQFARCTMMLGLRLQVCRSIQNSPSRAQPKGERQSATCAIRDCAPTRVRCCVLSTALSAMLRAVQQITPDTD